MLATMCDCPRQGRGIGLPRTVCLESPLLESAIVWVMNALLGLYAGSREFRGGAASKGTICTGPERSQKGMAAVSRGRCCYPAWSAFATFACTFVYARGIEWYIVVL